MDLKLSREGADVFVPDGRTVRDALAGVTHLCLAAHQDDLEVMAIDAIVAGHRGEGVVFAGVVVTDGTGSALGGPYARQTRGELRELRRAEQREAAVLGRYAAVVQLDHPSADVRGGAGGAEAVRSDLRVVLEACPAVTVAYLHNPWDKHDTHVGVLLRSLEAVRGLPPERRPARLLGIEGWRGLDWVPDERKVVLDAGRDPALAAELIGVFRSQVGSGKRYDRALEGRRLANATFHEPRALDAFGGATYAVDLTPLVREPFPDVAGFADALVEELRSDVAVRLARCR